MKRSRIAVGCALGALVVVATACQRQVPTAPVTPNAYMSGRPSATGPAPAGAFFPLTIGDRWHSISNDRVLIEPVGGGPPTDEFTIHNDISRELIGTEALLGRQYVVEAQTTIQTSPLDPQPETFLEWIRSRQDGTGLYEADVAVTTPPILNGAAGGTGSLRSGIATRGLPRPLPASLAARIPAEQRSSYEAAWSRLRSRVDLARSVSGSIGGALDSELTRLQYPLHPGATWAIRTTPFLALATVEGTDALDLPAGRFPSYRIRLDNDAFGPEASVKVWYGRSGQLQMRFHLVSSVTDENGNVIARMVDDSTEILEDLALVKP